MNTKAFLDGLSFNVGDGGGPEAFNKLEEVKSVGSVGKTNDTVDVTNFDSGGQKEFINALSDGSEFTVDCNYIVDPAFNVVQQQLVADADAKVNNRNIEMVSDDGVSSITLSFAVVCTSWSMTPGLGEASSISFGFKITGSITQS